MVGSKMVGGKMVYVFHSPLSARALVGLPISCTERMLEQRYKINSVTKSSQSHTSDQVVVLTTCHGVKLPHGNPSGHGTGLMSDTPYLYRGDAS